MEKIGKYDTNHVKITIGIPFVSNRQIFTIVFDEDWNGDEHRVAATSEQLDDFLAEHKDMIKKDVVATTFMDYTKVKFVTGGVQYSHVEQTIIGGNLPNNTRGGDIKKKADETEKLFTIMKAEYAKVSH